MCIKIQKIQKDFVITKNREDDTPNVLLDLKSLLNILKTVGLFPMFTQTAANEIEAPTKNGQLYSFCVRTFIHLLTIFTLYNIFYNGFSIHKVSGETDSINQYVDTLISMSTYTATVVLFGKHSKDFLRIFKEILKVDSDIEQRYGASVSNNCNFFPKVLSGVAIVQFSLACTNFMVLGIVNPQHFLAVTFNAVQYCICTVAVMVLSAVLRVLSMRFKFVNMIIDNFTFNASDEIKRRVPSNLSFEEDVLFAFRMHSKLLKTYKLLNGSCSLMVAFFMGYAFYAITTNTYNIFVEFTTKRILSWSLLLNCFQLLALNTVILSILTSNCGETTSQANSTSQILARVYGQNRDYQSITDKFLTKSIKQEVQFTAYGFFVVDNSTLFSIFSAVTTYLVILIQFKQLEETKLEEDQTSTIRPIN